MSGTINFGIDLGTTNSLIAQYINGSVEIFKNPNTLKDTLPSVVAFRRERTIVGDKAKELIEKDAENVIAAFKRKMGTTDTYFVPNLNDFKTPIALSTIILKELKNFLIGIEIPESVVITIPASFDTIQSNATKTAGLEAGFKEVVLLQEPIAASLAYINKKEATKDTNSKWIVYDLGGGTFDVALMKVEDGEISVLDNEGDNYLGGLDFDLAIIEKIIFPFLIQKYNIQDIDAAFKSIKGKYHTLFYVLLKKAEEAKIGLTSAASVDLEFEIEDADGNEQEEIITITRFSFENAIRLRIEQTVEFVEHLLSKNNIVMEDISEIILVGGSTYIPMVRRMLEERLQIPVNQGIDPTTAVAVGAAYYAGTKSKTYITPKVENRSSNALFLEIKTAYQKATQEREEYFAAMIKGDLNGLNYRIVRRDLGFDSGLKPLTERISENLLLAPGVNNQFDIQIFDSNNNRIDCTTPLIEIMQGKFSLHGQPVPNDICIEVDDIENNTTLLEVIFERNSILPLRKTIVKQLMKTIPSGSSEVLIINILEGSRYAIPAACLPIGMIEIKGTDTNIDLVKGSDIEITLQMSESRDLKIDAILQMNDKEFGNIFNPTERFINRTKLMYELNDLIAKAEQDLKEAERQENFELSFTLVKCKEDLKIIWEKVSSMSFEEITDEKYQMEEQKRKIASRLYEATRNSKLNLQVVDYLMAKSISESLCNEPGNENFKAKFLEIIKNEKDYLQSGNVNVIKNKIKQLNQHNWQIRKNDPSVWISAFYYFLNQPTENYKKPKEAQNLIERGEKALERNNTEELKVVVSTLSNLLIDEEQGNFHGTGIG